MIFKCRNCGGNMVYHPEKETLWCPHCESVDSEEVMDGGFMEDTASMEVCANCGAPLEVGEYTSALKCSHCGTYVILNQRVEGKCRPELILPFKITKQQAVQAMEKEFKKRFFTPAPFLSQSTMEFLEGSYVPFWLYDYDAKIDYVGNATRVHVYRRGDTEYTETSHYHVVRDMDIAFEKVPADASIRMADDVMDLMEPYEYQALQNFEEKYMSGFFGETANYPAEELQERAEKRVKEDAEQFLRDSVSGYTTCLPIQKTVDIKRKKAHFALLPVWIYKYHHRGKEYIYHVNGQTGKVIGTTPIDKKKVGFSFAGLAAAVLLSFGIGAGINAMSGGFERTNTECITDERVFDYADVLTDAEEQELRESIAEAERNTGCDIVVVTLEESLKEYAESYEDRIGAVQPYQYTMVFADNFYDEGQFGYDAPYGDGVILVDNWYREADGSVYSWMSTSGKAYEHYSSDMIDDTLNECLENVTENPAEAYETFVRLVDTEMSPTGGMMIPMVVTVIAVILAVILLVAVFAGSKKGENTVQKSTYVSGGRPDMKRKEDQFLHKTVTKRHIQTNTGSGGSGGGGGHVSAGGHTHGGGGHSR